MGGTTTSWQRRRDLTSQVSPAFTVALSREVGTDGTAVAQEVGRQLGWHVYDHELLEHIAKEMGLRTALLESVDEKNQSWLLETVEAFASTPTQSDWGTFVSESDFVHHLVANRARTWDPRGMCDCWSWGLLHPAPGHDVAGSPRRPNSRACQGAEPQAQHL